MVRRSFCLLPLLASACAAAPAPPFASRAARPGPAELPARLRQAPWMTRFWEELTPAQRRRVQARLRRQDPPVTDDAEAAKHWDALGLPQRNALLFGPGREPQAASLAAAPASAMP
jgi:hypothetical protein